MGPPPGPSPRRFQRYCSWVATCFPPANIAVKGISPKVLLGEKVGRLKSRQHQQSLGSDYIRRSKAPLLPQALVTSRRGALGCAGPPADCSTVLYRMRLSTPPQTKDLNPAGGRTDTSLGARMESDAWATSPTDRKPKGVIGQYNPRSSNNYAEVRGRERYMFSTWF